MKYTVVILDDEEPARTLMQSYCDKLEELNVVAVLDNALAAKRAIEQNDVDILLSDIEMDDLSGIDLVRTLKSPPVTIFTTAYSEYALEGYELDIADYLVKPVSFLRFCKAIDKASELIQFRSQKGSQVAEDTGVQATISNPSSYFFVKTNRKMVKVNYADLLFIESYGEYVKLYTHDDVILALQTTGFMEEMLPTEDFLRIHRSHIVNLRHIQEIDGNTLILEGHRLVVSKRMKERFLKKIAEKGII